MKKLIQLAHSFAWLLLSATALHGEVPGVISYQGRITISGTNYTGNGWFKFAIVNATDDATAWSNDGSSTGGSPPAAAVPLSVSGGVFTVNLGDTNLAGITQPIPAATFTNNPLYLAVWFSADGTNYTAVTPNLRFVANGYALNAANAEAVSAGAVNGTNLAANISIMTTGTIQAGAFTGGGAGLTGLKAANLSGSLADSQLSTNVALLNGSAAFAGTVSAGNFSGNGAGVSNLSFGNLSAPAILSWGSHFSLTATLPGASDFLTAADVNGDGKTDLISADISTGSLNIYTNNGAGGFALASSPSVGFPWNVIAADVNGDGRIDLISPNPDVNNLTVLTNDGSGGFSPASTPAVGDTPIWVAAADVNGDGWIDLISANEDNTLTVLTNNGHGGFTTAGTVSNVPAPVFVATADMNGDGTTDLIVVCSDDQTVKVYTNNAVAGFKLAGSVAARGAQSAAVFDLDGDGRPDVVTTSFLSPRAALVYTNNGLGGLALKESVALTAVPQWITAADVNGDGRQDLIISEIATINIYTNDGAGGFSAGQTLSQSGAVQIVAADFNGDGRMEFAAASDSTMSVFLNIPAIQGSFSGNGSGLTSLNATNLSGSVPIAALTSVPAASLTGSVADARLSTNVARLNGSAAFAGTVSAGSFSGGGAGITNVSLLNITDPGVLSWGLNYSASILFSNTSFSTVIATDLNGDGKPDLAIAAGYPAGIIYAYTNNGGGGFALASFAAVPEHPSTLVAADVNGDGAVDLITVNYFDNSLTVLTNNGRGGFAASTTLPVASPYAVAAVDVNGDGKLDLLAVGLAGSELYVLTNNGSGQFISAAPVAEMENASFVTAADLNGDGRVELIVAEDGDDSVKVLTNNGAGGFGVSLSVPARSPVGLVVVDVNGDGRPDVVVATQENGLPALVYTNDGGGRLTLRQSITLDDNQNAVVTADVNGDGYPDLVFTENHEIQICTNDGTGTFSVAATLPSSAGVNTAVADFNGDGKLDFASAKGSGGLALYEYVYLPSLRGTFSGDGSGLTGLNAASLAGSVPVAALTSVPAGNLTGSITDARLSTNVALLNGVQTFSGTNTFISSANRFTGDGSGLTGVKTANLSGAIADSQLSTNVALLSGSPTFSGAVTARSFSGNGSCITNVGLTNISAPGVLSWGLNYSTAIVSANFPGYMTTADVNNDGKPDLIAASRVGSSVLIFTNNGSGGFAIASTPAVGSASSAVVAADVNGDGKIDLISADLNNNSLTVLTNNGSCGFATSATLPVGIDPQSVAAADVNGDGKTDLICANLIGNSVSILTNNGGGGFTTATTITGFEGPYFVTSADINGDSKPDLIVTSLGDSSVKVLTNNGSGGFVLSASVAESIPNSNPIAAAVFDVNGDGRPDVVVASSEAAFALIYTNSGGGKLVLQQTIALAGDQSGVTAVDVNGDGFTDLIFTEFNEVQICTNNGAGGFSVAATLSSSDGFNTVVADFNGDGYLDLAGANLNGGIAVYLHETILSLTGIFSGNGSNLTNLSVSNLSGTLAASQLPSNVALLDANQTFSGTNLFLGRVGIGTSSTKAMLQVQGSVSTVPGGQYGYLNVSGDTGEATTGAGNTAQAYSIWASDRIAASAFNAISDARVKNIRGRSDAAADLRTLMDIEVTDYTFKDTVAKGNRPQKKVIAQQVEQVYPQAVSTTRDVVPDIFVKAEAKNGWVRDNSGHLKTGERVRIVSGDKTEIYEVIAANDTGFRVNLPADGKVFVYGREVSDFHTVDYDAIAMLNVSATQAQQREIERLQVENASLRERLQKIEQRLAAPSRETAVR